MTRTSRRPSLSSISRTRSRSATRPVSAITLQGQTPTGANSICHGTSSCAGAISPVLANLFMHYALDKWLEREFPAVAFERYADDGVIHCASEYQAREVLAALHERMAGVGLELHPDKTRIVYCKDSNRRGSSEHTSFTFLGSTFRPRWARRRDGVQFTAFLPAISKDALKKISAEVRSWRLHRHTELDSAGIARWINPKVRGLDDLLRGVLPLGAVSPAPPHQLLPDAVADEQVQEVPDLEESHPGLDRSGRDPAAVLRPLFLGETGPPDDQDDKSRITGDRYVRICGSPGVRFPRATRLTAAARHPSESPCLVHDRARWLDSQ